MYIQSPLNTLDIITKGAITDDQSDGDRQASLLLNQTELIAKGTLDYCRDTRREILTNRGFTVPQDWELSWNHKLGPIWTPDQLTGDIMWCDQRGMYNDDTVTAACTRWENQLDSLEYWSQLYTDDSPSIASTGQNGFKYLSFNGSDEFMVIPSLRHEDDAAMTMSLNPGADGSGNAGQGGFIMALVCTVDRDTGGEDNIVTNPSNFSNQGWDIKHNTASTATQVKVRHAGTTGNGATTGPTGASILLIGRRSSALTVLRQSGLDNVNVITGDENCDGTYGTYFGILGANKTGGANYMGHIYETIFCKQTAGYDLTDMANIEGYLAAKYNIDTSNATTYSASSPPRQGLINNG